MTKPLKKIETKDMIVYYDNCHKCNKEIIGKSIAQWRLNMTRHLKKCEEKKE